jgi:hypothetical protein
MDRAGQLEIAAGRREPFCARQRGTGVNVGLRASSPWLRRTTWFWAMGCALAMAALSGCASSSNSATGSSDTVTSTTAPTTTTSRSSASGSTTVPSVNSSGPTTTLNPAIVHPTSGIEFRSPTANIHCEIDYGPPYSHNAAFCFSAVPPQSATLSDTGTYNTCTGITCLANPGEGELELPYGQSISLGPFRCTSSTLGMTCTANGKGFEISRSGIVTA